MTERSPQAEAAHRRHHACKGCGSTIGRSVMDGKDCGGLPGIPYRVCSGCGHAEAIVKKERKVKL